MLGESVNSGSLLDDYQTHVCKGRPEHAWQFANSRGFYKERGLFCMLFLLNYSKCMAQEARPKPNINKRKGPLLTIHMNLASLVSIPAEHILQTFVFSVGIILFL